MRTRDDERACASEYGTETRVGPLVRPPETGRDGRFTAVLPLMRSLRYDALLLVDVGVECDARPETEALPCAEDVRYEPDRCAFDEDADARYAEPLAEEAVWRLPWEDEV